MEKTAQIPLKQSKLARLLEPVDAFLAAESAGGIVLMAAAMSALVWANSPYSHSYHDLWHAKVTLGFGGFSHVMSLEHWVNDGLMVIFFLLVGLEIKRELLIGELASMRQPSTAGFTRRSPGSCLRSRFQRLARSKSAHSSSTPGECWNASSVTRPLCLTGSLKTRAMH
jgi:hypothetical protein